MAATERYQTDVFAIIVVLASILVVVFLIVAAIYFNGIQNWTTIPGTSESIFLFWAAIVLGVIFLAIIIYGLYRIFTHRAVICPKPKVRSVSTESPSSSSSKPIIPVSNKQVPVKTTPVIETAKPVTTQVSKPIPLNTQVSTLAGYPSQITKTTGAATYPSQVTKTTSLASYPSQAAYPSQIATSQISNVPAQPNVNTSQSSLERELINLSSALEA